MPRPHENVSADAGQPGDHPRLGDDPLTRLLQAAMRRTPAGPVRDWLTALLKDGESTSGELVCKPAGTTEINGSSA